MFPVFKAQWMKDRRKPLLVLTFVGMSFLLSLIAGNGSQSVQITVPVFSRGDNAGEVEKKWLSLLNSNESLRFNVVEEGAARQQVAEGRADAAVHLMENDYRLVAASTLPTIQLVEQHVQGVFTREAMLQAAAGYSVTTELRDEVNRYLEQPPLQVEAQLLNGDALPAHNMGIQLLFGFTLFIAMFTIGFKVNGVTEDKVSGIWSRMILSPVSKTGMYAGHLAYSFCVGFMQIIILLLLFNYVFNHDLGSRFDMIVSIAAVYTWSMVSLAMLLTGLVRTPEQFNMVYPSVIPIIPLISGVYMPPDTINNSILLFIADLFPLTHAMEAMMDVAFYGVGWSEIALPMALMVLISVVSMGVGVNMVERRRI